MTPLISICIPTYNGSAFIAEAIDSAISQTYKNLEIIVSDDASKDDTLKIIESYKVKTNIPIFIHHHKPNGIGTNWNHCVKKANGEYIKFLFQDDVLKPMCIEKMVKFAIGYDNVGLVYSKREIIHDKKKLKDVVWVKRYGNLHLYWSDLNLKSGILHGKEYLNDKNLLDQPNNKIGEPPAVLIHKNVFKKAGYFSTKLKQELDFEFWYRLMPYFNIGFVDEELIKFRLHSNQATQVNKKNSSKDSTLLPILFFRNIFIYLHPTQKKKLLNRIIKNTRLYKFYVKLRLKMSI